jgi:hypothetical protein
MAFQYMTAILKKKGFGITMLKQREMITDGAHYYITCNKGRDVHRCSHHTRKVRFMAFEISNRKKILKVNSSNGCSAKISKLK